MKRLAMFLLVTVGAASFAWAEPAELVALNEKYQQAKARIENPRSDLDEAYQSQLSKIKSKAQSSGDLNAVLIADEEIKIPAASRGVFALFKKAQQNHCLRRNQLRPKGRGIEPSCD